MRGRKKKKGKSINKMLFYLRELPLPFSDNIIKHSLFVFPNAPLRETRNIKTHEECNNSTELSCFEKTKDVHSILITIETQRFPSFVQESSLVHRIIFP